MYLGRIVEIAPTDDALLGARTTPTRRRCSPRCRGSRRRSRRFSAIKGEIPSPLAPPPGCHFHPRCPFAFARCRVERPALKEIAPGRFSACHLNDEPGPRPGKVFDDGEVVAV